MGEIREGQTTITKEDKLRVTQKLRKIIDTLPKQIGKLKQEVVELEQDISDAKDLLEKVNKLEVV